MSIDLLSLVERLEVRIVRLEAELHASHRAAELPDDEANGIVRCDCPDETKRLVSRRLEVRS